MPVYVRFEEKEDLAWLQRLIDKAVVKLKTDPSKFSSDYTENIFRIHDALHSAASVEEAHLLGVNGDQIKEDKKQIEAKKEEKRREREAQKAAKVKANLCSKHPNNTLVRAPSTDCETCWAMYKKLHPLEYDLKRKAFERKKSAS